MGNAIKNYERKRRREQKEAQREIRKMVHDAIIDYGKINTELMSYDAIIDNCGFPKDFKEKESEVFECYNRYLRN